jgi:hypothetical protein
MIAQITKSDYHRGVPVNGIGTCRANLHSYTRVSMQRANSIASKQLCSMYCMWCSLVLPAQSKLLGALALQLLIPPSS